MVRLLTVHQSWKTTTVYVQQREEKEDHDENLDIATRTSEEDSNRIITWDDTHITPYTHDSDRQTSHAPRIVIV